MGRLSKKLSSVIFPILVFTFIFVVGTWTIRRFLRLTHLNLIFGASPEKKFMWAWDEDLKHLDKAHLLPQGFKGLKKIDLTSSSTRLRDAFKKYPLDLSYNPNGKYSLEIFADEIEGGGVVIQYDLIEIKSGNTVWELGRTFPQSL